LFHLFHPALHPLFESLGYAGGFALYRNARSRQGDLLTVQGAGLSLPQRP
jgi:hypothetical protein